MIRDYVDTPSKHMLSRKAQAFRKGSLATLVKVQGPFMQKVELMKSRGTLKAPPEDEEETEEELLQRSKLKADLMDQYNEYVVGRLSHMTSRADKISKVFANPYVASPARSKSNR